MNPKEIIETIKADINSAKEQGASAIETERLIKYLDALSNQVNEAGKNLDRNAELERIRAHYANQLAHYNWLKEQDIELFKSVITSGQNTLRASMLLHGGAAVALLAFIGHLVVNPNTKTLVSQFAPIMTCFLIGVLTVVVCHGITYLTQYCYHHQRNILGHVLNISSSVLSVFGYGLFGYACYLSYQVLKAI
ncbi:MAG: hypothetical protein HY739_03385 [Desulfobacterales bacterium]|nr:hypothetical protein [Desulfobacterales bacterium]